MFQRALSLCIRLSALAVFLGWLLSLLGSLNARGYLLAGIPATAAVVLITWWQQPLKRGEWLFWWRNLHRAFRPLAFVFWLSFGLIVLGSALHEPNNFDGLCYRIPKVFYWLDHRGWYWIDTPCEPVNYTLPNYEWLTVPIYLAAGGFHPTVVINWICFLLLPSLFFSLLRAFGASGRMARDWMWIFPSGYVIAMQAGGIGNDLCGLTALLAALFCAKKCVERFSLGLFADAVLATAFCTGVKLSNLPLAVFPAILLLGNPAPLRKRWLPVAILAGVALTISAAIPMALNQAHTGSIMGATPAWSYDKLTNPAAGLAGNTLILATTAVSPPLFPGAERMDRRLEQAFGARFRAWLLREYPKFNPGWTELPKEEDGGLGLGITLALCVAAAVHWSNRRAGSAGRHVGALLLWQRTAWWCWLAISFAAVAAKLGTGSAFPRNLLPWFPVVLAPLVGCIGTASVARSAVWRVCAVLASLSVVPALLLTPSRPVISPVILEGFARKCGLGSESTERLRVTYDIYAHRADAYAEIRKAWPAGERVIGLVSDGSEPTAGWWKPYGTHSCVYLMSDAGVDKARREGVRYVVIEDSIA